MKTLPEEEYKKLLNGYRKWELLKTVKIPIKQCETKNINGFNELLEAVIELVEKDVAKMEFYLFMGMTTEELREEGYYIGDLK